MMNEQGAFELWLADKCPSGDAESVQQQWLDSDERHDFAASVYDVLVRQRDELLAAIAEIDGCFEAALVEGWIEAMADEDISRIKDIYCRRIDYARGIAVAA